MGSLFEGKTRWRFSVITGDFIFLLTNTFEEENMAVDVDVSLGDLP